MNKLCFVIPYFGRFPNYFHLFLKSCSYNPEFDWLIITDNCEPYTYPQNVKLVNIKFNDLQAKVSYILGFDACLETPYKLCDYKPAYGFIFQEYLKSYEFWGHCDVDVIFGKLKLFLTDILLDSYDKIFCLGHMSIYRNDNHINTMFMNDYHGFSLYKHVFSTNSICWFDEVWKDDNNIISLFENYNKRIYKKDLSLNISTAYNQFHRVIYEPENPDSSQNGYVIENFTDSLCVWENGDLSRYMIKDGKLIKENFPYIHLQGRSLTVDASVHLLNRFKIVPDRFLPIEVSGVISIQNFDKIKRHYWGFHNVKKKIKRILKK